MRVKKVENWVIWAALVLSAGGHALVALAPSLFDFRPPDLGLKFKLPDDVELGFFEATSVEAQPETEPAEPAESEAATAAASKTPEEIAAEKARKAERRQKMKERREARERARREAAKSDFQRTLDIPEGAQIALRMNMEVIRKSPLKADVEKLLKTIPDWDMILAGSGVDPLTDLDALMITSSNLRRENMVFVGRHAHDANYTEKVVAAMHAASGSSPDWKREVGVPVASWPNRDRTRRVVAKVSAREFVISRPKDLLRIIAIAQKSLSDKHTAKADGSNVPGAGAQDDSADKGPLEHAVSENASAEEAVEQANEPIAILKLAKKEGLRAEVENLPLFARAGGTPPGLMNVVPLRGRLNVYEKGQEIEAIASFEYRDKEGAAAGKALLDRELEKLLRNGFVSMIYGRVLRGATIEVSGELLTVKVVLSGGEARSLLGFARQAIEGLLNPPPEATP